jgi:tetratricopeptide (TPR) repeat protein
LVCALLIWRLFWRLGLKWAWWGALIFAVHPLVVESVGWIAELKNTLSLLLLCLAMLSWLDYCDRAEAKAKRGGSRAYLFALAWFAAALLAKSTVVMFPFLILLYGWWRNGRLAWRDLKVAAPFFALSLALGLVTIWFQSHRAIVGQNLEIGGWPPRLAASGMAIGFYFEKFLWPVNLIPVYPRWAVVPPSARQFLPWLALALAAGVLWQKRRRWGRGALFGLGWIVFNLLPVLGWIPMSFLRLSWVADHFTYLSLVGLAGLAAAGMGRLADYLGRLRPRLRGLMPIAGVLAVVLLAGRARLQARIYRSDRAFWTYVQEKNPAAWIAANNLGLILLHAGQPGEAAAQFRQALAAGPDQSELRNNLGDALAALGRPAEALPQFEAALRLRPDLVDAEINLANALGQLGRAQEAAAHYRRALALRPDNGPAHGYLGIILAQLGQTTPAAEELREASRLNPSWAEPHYRLGSIWGNLGRMPEAVAEYREAVRLKPDYAEAWANLGLALAVAHDPAGAVAPLQEALRLRPGYAEAHAYLGFALAAQGRYEPAVAQYEEALRLGPPNADLRYQLAAALRALGRLPEARHQLELIEQPRP